MNYITVTEFRNTYDTDGTYAGVGDATVEMAITIASKQIDFYRGHTFEDSTNETKLFDGSFCEVLDMRRDGGLPLRELLELIIDEDTTVSIAATSVVKKPHEGPPYTHLHRRAFAGDPFPEHWIQPAVDFGETPGGVSVRGHWGWATVPADVKTCCYRLAVMYLSGSGLDRLATEATQGGGPIRNLKLMSGTQVEWAVRSVSTGQIAFSEDSTGDQYVDLMLDMVPPTNWRKSAEVI